MNVASMRAFIRITIQSVLFFILQGQDVTGFIKIEQNQEGSCTLIL